MPAKSKECTGCGELKPLSEFWKLRNGKSSRCKTCKRAYQNKWRQEHPEYGKDQWARMKARKSWRKSYLKMKYGLTGKKYEQMFNAQGGVCAICSGSEDRLLCVDHDHKTGKVRGLLCTQCNLMLGNSDDSPERLRLAIEYLER